MTTVGDEVARLQAKLEALEAKLQQQGQPDTSASGSGVTAPQIKVTVPRERKFGKYGGTRDDRILEDWISDAKRAVRGQTDGEAVDNLLFHLEGVAKEEVKLRPTTQWSNPEGVFGILRESFSEQLTETQATRKFFAKSQGEGESVQDFAHALMVLLGRVERLSGQVMDGKEKLLREQFVENLRDPTLRRDIKRWARDHPAATFQEVRLEVHRYMEEDTTPRRSAAARETAVDEVDVEAVEAAGRKRVLTDLVSGQKLLAEEVQRQQKTLMTHIEQQRQVLNQQQQTLNQLLAAMAWRPRPSGRACYNCGEEGHLARECPQRPPDTQQRRPSPQQSQKKREPALNGSTPPQ